MKNKNINIGLLTDAQVLAPEIRQSFNEHFDVKDASFARGRFAQVRRCVHKLTSAECAAKVMRKYRRAVDVSAEIMHEVRVLLMADKERHIVNLLQLYETTSEYILVLEMAAGGELQRVLDDYDSIPEAETKIMLKQLMNAVCFLHRMNIAHLDIKPQNILLSAPYPLGEVKLCDFGISRLITDDTELREIVGTADYVAPEILHYEPIFLTTDMWSIGILTYVMLTGYTPFGGETKQETYLNITQGTLDFPEDLFSGISESAIDFICKLLKKKPKQRLNSTKCLEHEWLVSSEPIISGTSVINEHELNEHSNQPMQAEEISTIHVNGLNKITDSVNNNVESKVIETVNQQTENSSFKQLHSNEQQVNNTNLLMNNNDQNDNQTIKCDSVIEKSVNSISSICNGQMTNCKAACEDKCNKEPPVKSIESNNENKSANELSSDNVNCKNSQELMNTISTNNSTTNELITTTCTNVTLLTAN